MSYLYKPVITVEAVVERESERVTPLGEEVKVEGKIKEITYEEHMKNLEFMCKTDREFMTRLRSFCEENKAEVELEPVQSRPAGTASLVSLNKKPPVDSEDEDHSGTMARHHSEANGRDGKY